MAGGARERVPAANGHVRHRRQLARVKKRAASPSSTRIAHAHATLGRRRAASPEADHGYGSLFKGCAGPQARPGVGDLKTLQKAFSTTASVSVLDMKAQLDLRAPPQPCSPPVSGAEVLAVAASSRPLCAGRGARPVPEGEAGRPGMAAAAQALGLCSKGRQDGRWRRDDSLARRNQARTGRLRVALTGGHGHARPRHEPAATEGARGARYSSTRPSLPSTLSFVRAAQEGKSTAFLSLHRRVTGANAGAYWVQRAELRAR